ncbi:hypothetical protein CWE09_04510 [Aliidiomarina minuta]|uniref:Uncharacterized protein n=1 Tax=Aliidiomarina minuta TaxID=880057 RepID=A0A432W7D3_9GAMM|nr:hypothetical protein CWE09_04510 [Aliidiomarina minuta]
MLDMVEGLFPLLEQSDVLTDEKQIEDIALLLARERDQVLIALNARKSLILFFGEKPNRPLFCKLVRLLYQRLFNILQVSLVMAKHCSKRNKKRARQASHDHHSYQLKVNNFTRPCTLTMKSKFRHED